VADGRKSLVVPRERQVALTLGPQTARRRVAQPDRAALKQVAELPGVLKEQRGEEALRQSRRLARSARGPSLPHVHLSARVRQAWLREQEQLLQGQWLMLRSSGQREQLMLASSALLSQRLPWLPFPLSPRVPSRPRLPPDPEGACELFPRRQLG
jgi:hypothetical protein